MPLFRALLVPIDGSEPSSIATDLALRLASDQRGSITFVYVIEVNRIIATIGPGQTFSDPTTAIVALRAAGAEILKDAVARAQAVGVEAKSELVEGDCVPAILGLVKSDGIDLIVIGSHGRGGLSRLVLGSVAEGVLRESTVPVLVARASKVPQTATPRSAQAGTRAQERGTTFTS